MLKDPGVEALVAAAQQGQPVARRQLARVRVVEDPAARVERHDPPRRPHLVERPAVGALHRGRDHVHPEHHPRPAAERRVVDRAVLQRGVVAVAVEAQPQAVGQRVLDGPLLAQPGEPVREQGEDVELEHLLTRRGGLVEHPRRDLEPPRGDVDLGHRVAHERDEQLAPVRIQDQDVVRGPFQTSRTTPTGRLSQETAQPTRSNTKNESSCGSGSRSTGSSSTAPRSASTASRSVTPSSRITGGSSPRRAAIRRSSPATSRRWPRSYGTSRPRPRRESCRRARAPCPPRRGAPARGATAPAVRH